MASLSFQQTCISLPNGAQGVLAQAPHLTRAHVSIAIAAGYLDEPRTLPGLAHLLEHVLTTAPLEAFSNISLLTWFSQHQGSLNAHTDDYVTDVHFSIPAETLEAAALTVASQLARPAFSPSVICAEVAAIDAEWQARQHSSAMQRLSAIATLSDSQHIGADCRHGNAQTLGSDTALLLDALTAFHRDHYHDGRVSIAIISPWATETMTRLVKRMATLFSPPTPSAPSLAITSRWSRLPHAKIARTGNAIELLWPLPSAVARHQLTALGDTADRLNQGFLVEQLPGSITDYRATLAPSGTTDAFSLTLSGTATQEQVKALAAALSERLAALLGTIPNDHNNRWQPPADTVQLAPAWFAHARHQALARRFTAQPSEHQPDASPFAANNARWLLDNASPSPSPPAFDRQPAAYPAVQHWCGLYGVNDDFAALVTTAWAACFVPEAIIVSSPLTAQRLALQAIVFKQENSPHGSWVITVGSQANHAMVALLEDAVLAVSKAQQGLQAQQLIQRLTPLPATPAVWVSHSTGAAAVCHALANLASHVAIRAEQPPPASLPTSTAIMRTLSLPGTPSQRLLLALAEQHHSAAFFQQARYDHHLGYVAAVRRGDGAPCSLGYVVQASNAGQVSKDAGSAGRKPIEEKLRSITDALWQESDSVLQAQLPTLTPPETPLAALTLQWQSLLAGTHQPLHRLGQQRIDSQALTNLLSQINTLGHWQTHWLDSAGHYFVSD
ncbi:MAG: insulinase family protein [Vreelandella alkaliphila]|uniref:Peptidase M16 n=2 Tax=Halomonas TaxID=2745 RepID=A0A3D0KGD3_9GAMM|nr:MULTISPECIES: insulinase family protein [unclassified Halomonas]HBP41010.1 peptidase M16 [Halomonas sp.]HCA02229.1 peptidase M16 [Halomonas campaniensis]